MTLADILKDTAGVRWHPTRNPGLYPESLTGGSHKKVWWQCAQGHDWEAPVYSVALNGSGCPRCSGLLPIPGETDLETLCPQVAALWDRERNGSLTPGELTPGSKRKVWWRCPQGHSWEASVYSTALDGTGCPWCAGKLPIPGETDLATLHPEIAAQWDREKNGDLTPESLLPSSHEKVWWRCCMGHSWQAPPFSRTREKGSGCPYCTGKKVLPGFNDLAAKHPALASQWYQSLNGDLHPTDVTPGSNKKVWWRCRENHVWQAAVYSRTRKNASGCPVCAGTVKKPLAVTFPTRRARIKEPAASTVSSER